MGKFGFFGFLMSILKVFKDGFVVSEKIFFIETLDKISIFCQPIKCLVTSPDLFLNNFDELLRSKYFFDHVFLYPVGKIYFKVFFGRQIFIQSFSFDLADNTLEGKSLLLLPFILDLFENKQFVSGFSEHLKENSLIKIKVIDFHYRLEILLFVWRAVSSVNQVF